MDLKGIVYNNKKQLYFLRYRNIPTLLTGTAAITLDNVMVSVTLSTIASMIVIIYVPFWLIRTLSTETITINKLKAIWPLTLLIIMPLSGTLGALRTEILFVALVMLALLPNKGSFFDISWRFMLRSLSFGLFLAPNSRIIVSVIPASRVTVAGSMDSTSPLLDQAFGAKTIANILSKFGTNFHWRFLIAARFTAPAILLSVTQLLHSDKIQNFNIESGGTHNVKPS
jgi:hypothetical protein